MAKSNHGKKAVAQGTGPSKRFSAPKGSYPENPILDCHVGGVQVRDLPEDVQNRILYAQTDEGIEESNQGKAEPGSAARVTHSELDGRIAERRDFRADSTEPWEAPDPMKDLIEEHVGPGMRGKFMSPRKCDRQGMRGFQPVLVDGAKVKLGEMFLAEMPIEKAEERNRFYRERGSERLKQIYDEYTEERERMQRDAERRPLPTLQRRRASGGDTGLHSESIEEFQHD